MFASSSIIEHVGRGAIGFGAIGAAIVLARFSGLEATLASIVLAIGSLVAFRGCPVCWTVGLVETVRGKWSSHIG